MNLSPRWQTMLADAGTDLVHWLQVGDPRSPDSFLASSGEQKLAWYVHKFGSFVRGKV